MYVSLTTPIMVTRKIATPKKQRIVLTLDQKHDAIKQLESGRPAYKIAADLGVGKTQIQELRKRKLEILSDIENHIPGTSKRRRYLTGNEDINELTHEWFKDAVNRRIPISGPLLQTKALDFSNKVGNSDFKASKGWLESFLKRNNISFGSCSSDTYENRYILLFVDNAPSHPKSMKLSNIKIAFFPPNTTCLTQPMDQGIIQATKLKFHKRQLLHFAREMDSQPTACGTDLLKQITILDAIMWISNSWDEVETSTIEKCFAKGGFHVNETVCNDINPSASDEISNDSDDSDDDVPLAALKLANDLFGCAFQDLVNIDQHVHTCETEAIDWGKPASELLAELHGEVGEADEVSGDSDDEHDINLNKKPPTFTEVQGWVSGIKHFALHQGNSNILVWMTKVDESLVEMFTHNQKQRNIEDFFERTT